MRWLKERSFVQPLYVKLPLKASKHDDSRVMADFAVVPPVQLAAAIFAEYPQLIFPESAQQQRRFFRRLRGMASSDQAC
jgi:hypothetical protein